MWRVAVETTLYSSTDLTTWTSVATPAPLQAFATDGAVVSALAAEPAGGNHTYYPAIKGRRGERYRSAQRDSHGSRLDFDGYLGRQRKMLPLLRVGTKRDSSLLVIHPS